MNLNGKVIHIEGADGTGKTTQVKKLSNYLKEKGYKVIEARQPGHTELGEDIRRTLFSRNLPMSLEAQRALFSTDHINFISEIYKNKGKDEIVICDRYNPMSNIVYGHFGENMNIDYIMRLNAIASENNFPDLIIVLTISGETMMNRLNARQEANGEMNRYDFESIEFKNRIREGYLDVGKYMNIIENWRTKYVSTEGSEEEVFESILKAIEENFEE